MILTNLAVTEREKDESPSKGFVMDVVLYVHLLRVAAGRKQSVGERGGGGRGFSLPGVGLP